MPASEVSPTTLELMITLPPSRSRGRPCLSTWKAPITCTSTTRRNTSAGYSVIGAITPLIPALLNSTSRPPNRSTAWASATITWSSSVTSVTLQLATSGPSSATAATSRSVDSPARWTRAPSAANSRAVARPMPLSPPVISATLFASRAMAPPVCTGIPIATSCRWHLRAHHGGPPAPHVAKCPPQRGRQRAGGGDGRAVGPAGRGGHAGQVRRGAEAGREPASRGQPAGAHRARGQGGRPPALVVEDDGERGGAVPACHPLGAGRHPEQVGAV